MEGKLRIAVIDLGTNTFHLIISEIENGKSFIIYKKRQYVKLAANGISEIDDEAFSRGLETIYYFNKAIESYEVSKIYAFGTAALRSAVNANRFINAVYNNTGINIQVIDGDTEALYIWKGVKQAVNLGNSKSLIMDIGGGSVEFIIANQNEIFWKKSIPIGAAILKSVYHKTDPITSESKILLNQFLDDMLKPLWENVAKHKISTLIGASGTFDTIVDIQMAKKGLIRDEDKPANIIDVEEFKELLNQLVDSTLSQRIKIQGLPEERAEMIVVSSILVDIVINRLNIQNIIQSEYALKQGVLWSVIYDN